MSRTSEYREHSDSSARGWRILTQEIAARSGRTRLWSHAPTGLIYFSPATWQEFVDSDMTVSGFRENRWSTVQRIRPGDYLLCYLTQVSRFIGVLEVTSEPYFERDHSIWKDDDFHCRVNVRVAVCVAVRVAVDVGVWLAVTVGVRVGVVVAVSVAVGAAAKVTSSRYSSPAGLSDGALAGAPEFTASITSVLIPGTGVTV